MRRWQYLAGRDLTQHEALAKQLADVLDFIIQFDYEKMMKTGREGVRERQRLPKRVIEARLRLACGRWGD